MKKLFCLLAFLVPSILMCHQTRCPHSKKPPKLATAFCSSTNTPIKHIIVIFQENRPFDHYFGTYPHAQNNPGEPKFVARKHTPSVNGFSFPLRQNNQNLAQPFRLSPAQVDTCNPNHKYTTLQQSCHAGLMDQFVQTSGMNCT